MQSHDRELAVSVVIPGIPTPLSYAIDEAAQHVQPGDEVLVEVGRRRTTGWVVDKQPISKVLENLEDRDDAQMQFFSSADKGHSLKFVLEAQPAFSADLLKLFEWMSQYYGCSLVDAIENAVPKRSPGRSIRFVSLSEEMQERLKHESDLLASIEKRAPLQASVLKHLSECKEAIPQSELAQYAKSISGVVKTLENKGFVLVSDESAYKFAVENSKPLDDPKPLTPSQQQAAAAINASIERKEFEPFLLFGVTGSGKTEVYLNAIDQTLKTGGSALVVVPEIALTPQLFDQFASRLSAPVAVLHSQVGVSERWGAWEGLLRGDIRVAIGARSAVFAPMVDLSLIIVDEEHENSYKQSDGLRYHGRDLAIMRAKFANCPVVLGSATPSFESLLNAKRNRYTLLEMPERVTKRALPSLEIVDLGKIKRKEMVTENISPPLAEAMKTTIADGGQIVILYNRRGFSSYLQCDTCGEAVSCPNCSVTLTYHRKRDALVCHYCGLSVEAAKYCATCRDPKLSRVELGIDGEPIESEKTVEAAGLLTHRGGGTEKIVDEIQSICPDAKIARMDRDTVGKKDSYRDILGGMRRGETDILVGTQMIAKGHDLPGVTLVGIIDADIGLHLPDFRSTEKIFQLITQAAGRAGRGKEQGRVVVQTFQPNHPTIVATATNRFKAFARYELEQRKGLGYPPWGQLLRLVVSSTEINEAHNYSQHVVQAVRSLLAQRAVTPEQAMVLGPAPAPHERLRGRYRWHILIKSPKKGIVSALARDLTNWKREAKLSKDFRLTIDVDPVDML